MIRVLLVDQVKPGFQWVMDYLDWNMYGFDIVAASSDLQEAMVLFKKFYPQLIILNGALSKLSGFLFIREVKKASPETGFVYIAENKDFDELYRAMDIGVLAYILKGQVTRESFLKKLLRVKKQIQWNSKQQRFIREETLLSLFADQLEKEEIQNGLDIYPNQYDLYLLEQDHYPDILAEASNNYIRESPEKNVKAFLYAFSRGILAVVHKERYRYILITEPEENVNDFAYSLKNKIRAEFGQKYSILTISESESILQCIQQGKAVGDMILERYFYGTSIVMHYVYYQGNRDIQSDINVQKISELINTHAIDEVNKYIDQMYLDSIRQRDYLSFCDITKRMLGIFLEYHESLMDFQNGRLFTVLDEGCEENWWTAADIVQWIKEKCLEICEIIFNNRLFSYSKDVQVALTYIYQNFMDSELSVESIAAQTKLSANRLNVVVKEETGRTIGQIVTDVRIDKSKNLLLNENYKILDIYPMVGYSTMSYFSRVFKKKCGMSPQIYRKTQKKENINF